MDTPLGVIVGAGPGIGAATARRFAREGYALGLIARTPDRLTDLGEELRRDGVPVRWATADAADAAGLGAAIDDLVGPSGRADVLLYNVSTFRAAPASRTTADDLLADLAVGTAGLLSAVHAVLPGMRTGGGTVLVTGGGSADRPMREGATLGVQKAAIRALAHVLALDVAEHGVHVATVTVRGVLEEGTPFAPERIADLYAELVAETAGPREQWRTIVDLTAEGARTIV